MRRRWDEVLATVAGMRRATWALVSQNAQVGELTGNTLSLVFSSTGLATAFRNGSHSEVVQRALLETLGVDVRVEGALAGAENGAASSVAGAPPVAEGRRAAVPMAPPARSPAASAAGSPSTGSPSAASPASAPSDVAPSEVAPSVVPPPWDVPGGTPPSAQSPGVRSRPSTAQSPEEVAADSYAQAMSEIDDSDPTLDESSTIGVPLIAEMLGGTIIEEQVDQS